jgi:hypothetical protein
MAAQLALRRRNKFDIDRISRHCADTTHLLLLDVGRLSIGEGAHTGTRRIL